GFCTLYRFWKNLGRFSFKFRHLLIIGSEFFQIIFGIFWGGLLLYFGLRFLILRNHFFQQFINALAFFRHLCNNVLNFLHQWFNNVFFVLRLWNGLGFGKPVFFPETLGIQGFLGGLFQRFFQLI